jgi:hypothetical protein
MVVTGMLALAVHGQRLSAQPPVYARLSGTWVMDSTNGPDDHGLPKSETLVFSTAGPALQIAATEDDGKGPDKSAFSCTPKGSTADLGGGLSARCTVHPFADSTLYAVDVLQGGKVVSGERGRLVPLAGGKRLRDEYDASSGTAPATHHRHIYTKQ